MADKTILLRSTCPDGQVRIWTNPHHVEIASVRAARLE